MFLGGFLTPDKARDTTGDPGDPRPTPTLRGADAGPSSRSVARCLSVSAQQASCPSRMRAACPRDAWGLQGPQCGLGGPSVGLFLLWPGRSFLSPQIRKESEVRLNGYTECLARVLPLGARVEAAGCPQGWPSARWLFQKRALCS